MSAAGSFAAIQREKSYRKAEGRLVRKAVPAILESIEQMLGMHEVRLCGFCFAEHHKAQRTSGDYPCYLVQCQCWCSTGRD